MIYKRYLGAFNLGYGVLILKKTLFRLHSLSANTYDSLRELYFLLKNIIYQKVIIKKLLNW